jgi:hypothetical protein
MAGGEPTPGKGKRKEEATGKKEERVTEKGKIGIGRKIGIGGIYFPEKCLLAPISH